MSKDATVIKPAKLSVGDRLNAFNGAGPGFAYLRTALALIIMATHAMTLKGLILTIYNSPLWIIRYACVPMFFILSGFLISASAKRLTVSEFAVNRCLRITPALTICTVICALVIGPVFTTMSPAVYFSDPKFAGFFFNVVGGVHYYLPGLFEDHLNPRLNGSLWSLPFEILCYGLACLVVVTGAIKYRLLGTAIAIGYILTAVVYRALAERSGLHGPLNTVLDFVLLDERPQSILAFVCGVAAYQNRSLIPYSRIYLGLSIAVLVAAGLFMTNDLGQRPEMRLMLMPALTYLVMFIGMTPLSLPAFFRGGDYSYGIYLYHQPFQQVAISLVPGGPFWLILMLTVPFVLTMAWLSWHFIEKPVYAVRKLFRPRVQAIRLGTRAHQPVRQTQGQV